MFFLKDSGVSDLIQFRSSGDWALVLKSPLTQTRRLTESGREMATSKAMIAPSLQPTRLIVPSFNASMKSTVYEDMVSKLKASAVSAVCPCPCRAQAQSAQP